MVGSGAVWGEKARRLFSGALRPCFGYGAKVNGVSPTEMKLAKRLFARTVPSAGKGRNLHALLLCYDDPTSVLATACFEKWAKTVWSATCAGAVASDIELGFHGCGVFGRKTREVGVGGQRGDQSR